MFKSYIIIIKLILETVLININISSVHCALRAT